MIKIVIHTLYHAFTDEKAVQTGLIFEVVAPVILILTVGLVSTFVAVVVMKIHRKKPSKFSLSQISVTDCVVCLFYAIFLIVFLEML